MNSPADNKKPTPPPTPHPGSRPPGVPAAAANTAPVNAAPTNGTTPTEDNGAEEDKAANRSKLFIVVGEIHEFPTAAKAEKFLNEPNAPKQFSVIRGHKVESKQRVSLR